MMRLKGLLIACGRREKRDFSWRRFFTAWGDGRATLYQQGFFSFFQQSTTLRTTARSKLQTTFAEPGLSGGKEEKRERVCNSINKVADCPRKRLHQRKEDQKGDKVVMKRGRKKTELAKNEQQRQMKILFGTCTG